MLKEKRKYTKREAPFTTKLQRWMKHHMKFTYAWEVKYVDKDKYYFSSDKSFKKELLNLLAGGRSFVYKHSDASTHGTPYDGYTLWNTAGYFFITWDGKKFYVIECSVMRDLSEQSKYITESMVESVAYLIDSLK